VPNVELDSLPLGVSIRSLLYDQRIDITAAQQMRVDEPNPFKFANIRVRCVRVHEGDLNALRTQRRFAERQPMEIGGFLGVYFEGSIDTKPSLSL